MDMETKIAGKAAAKDSIIKKGALAALAALAIAAAAAALPAGAAHADSSTPVSPMHRLYNPNSGEHFYTASEAERGHLVGVGWSYEGVGWYAPKSGEDVYRLYNANAGDHHYTRSAAERDYLVRVGWSYEGVGWKSGGAVSLLRQYNPNAAAGAHNYTASRGENDQLVGLGWRAEGVGWNGVSHEHSWAPVTKQVTVREQYDAIGEGPSSWAHVDHFRATCKELPNYHEYYYTDDNGARQQGMPYVEFTDQDEANRWASAYIMQHGYSICQGLFIASRDVTKTVTAGYRCASCGSSK